MNEEAVLKNMALARLEAEDTGEYVVRGATVKCTNGSQPCVLNLQQDYGNNIEGSPKINIQDTKPDNLSGFGMCKKDDRECRCKLTKWITGNNTEQVWDNSTLKYEYTVQDSDAYCVCLRNSGFAKMSTSGQNGLIITMPRVYITRDKKSIVVNDKHYDIYNPNDDIFDIIPGQHVIRPTYTWYTLWEYTMNVREFDLSKAILGYTLELEDFLRNELVVYTKGIVEYGNGNTKHTDDRMMFSGANVSARSPEAKKMFGAVAFCLATDILKRFADAVEDTYVTFFFQKSNEGKRRVVLLGGTKSDVSMFNKYNYYNRYKTYLDHVVPKNFREVTKQGIIDVTAQWIFDLIPQIGEGVSKAKIVEENGNYLFIDTRDNTKDYYDMGLKLSTDRKSKKYQVYLYSENGCMCQKKIIFANESFSILRRRGDTIFSKIFPLIEFIDTIETLYGNYKFWEIFENVLQRWQFGGIEDFNDNKTKPSEQSISDLINIKGVINEIY